MKISNLSKMILAIGLFLVMGSFVSVKNAGAASRQDIVNHIKARTSEKIKHVYYTDYDSDGKSEAFVITEKDADQQTLWFSSDVCTEKLAQCIIYVNKYNGICKVSNTQKLFVAEGSAGGSGSWSYCLYVKNGRAYKVKKSGEGLCHVSGRDFTIHMSAFDADYSDGIWTTHTYKEYYLRWTGTKFKQYKGKVISQAKFKKYKGAGAYIKKIKKTGYKIGKIYKRSNGIININVSKKGGYGTSYSNVNFSVKGKKLKLRVCYKKGTNIVEKSGYGGVYKAAVKLFDGSQYYTAG